jgi:hypothetical protein
MYQREREDGGNCIMRSFLILLLTRCIRTGVNRTEHGDDEKGIQNFILATIREKKHSGGIGTNGRRILK